MKNKPDTQDVYKIIEEGVEICKVFYTDALPIRLLGMNEDNMIDYIMYVADRLLVDLGYNKKYNKPNPFSFMETIGMQTKTNFFEKRVSEYQKAGVKSGTGTGSISFDADF